MADDQIHVHLFPSLGQVLDYRSLSPGQVVSVDVEKHSPSSLDKTSALSFSKVMDCPPLDGLDQKKTGNADDDNERDYDPYVCLQASPCDIAQGPVSIVMTDLEINSDVIPAVVKPIAFVEIV